MIVTKKHRQSLQYSLWCPLFTIRLSTKAVGVTIKRENYKISHRNIEGEEIDIHTIIIVMKQQILSTVKQWGRQRNFVATRAGSSHHKQRSHTGDGGSSSINTRDTSNLTDMNSCNSSEEMESRSVSEETNDHSHSTARSSRPVDLDEVDDMMMIEYFEQDDNNDDNHASKQSSTTTTTTGPVDLDKLEDDIHYYDDELEEEEEEEEEELCAKEDDKDDNNEEDEDHLVNYQENTATTSGDKDVVETGTSPVDMDNIHDLQSDFDTILDEHEDEFMVWTEHRARSRPKSFTDKKKKREPIRYGESCRRQQKSSLWATTETKN